MPLQVVGSDKFLVAKMAGKKIDLSRVHADVLVQVASPNKLPVANIAGEIPFGRVDLEVVFEVVRSDGFAASVAGALLLPGVYL